MTEAERRRASSAEPVIDQAMLPDSFPDALRFSIDQSKLTLDRLEKRLAALNINVSRSTLSYWQRGYRRPEQVRSLQALTALEDILNVQSGALTALLGPKKRRGRWIDYHSGDVDWAEMWELSEDIRRIISSDNRRHNSRLQDISLTESFEMGADRRMQWLQVDTVTEARQAGADRMLLLYNGDPDMDVAKITLSNLENCRVGRHRFDRKSRFVVFEVLFERGLNERETYVYGFRVNFSNAFLSAEGPDGSGVPPVEATEGVRAFRTQSNAYVLKARFDAAALPVQCYQVRAGRTTEQQRDVAEIGLSLGGSTHIALQDVQPGVHGIRWDWE